MLIAVYDACVFYPGSLVGITKTCALSSNVIRKTPRPYTLIGTSIRAQ